MIVKSSFFIAVGIIIMIIMRVLSLQLALGEKAKAEQHYYIQQLLSTQTPPRGDFYDIKGQQLSFNNTYTKLSVDDVQAKQNLENLLIKLGLPVNKRNFDTEQSILIQASLDELSLSKIKFTTTIERNYADAKALSGILGYLSKPNEMELKAMIDRNSNSWIGKAGLEKQYNEVLQGSVDNLTKKKFQGNDLQLNINASWQNSLYKLLADNSYGKANYAASATIMEVDSGFMAALVSYPGYDGNDFNAGISADDFNKIIADNRRPLVNKSIGTAISPGSLAKPFVAYAALSNGVINKNFSITSRGCIKLDGKQNFCEIDRRYLGNVNVTKAIARSSNIYFCEVGKKYAANKGSNGFIADLSNWAFTNLTSVDLPGEVKGNLGNGKTALFTGDVCNISIGQGYFTVTPIRVAVSFAALFNGGKFYKPQLARERKNVDGFTVQQYPATVMGQLALSTDAVNEVKAGMKNTLLDARGTARIALGRYAQQLDLYVKTGSVEATEVIGGKIINGTHGWVVLIFNHQGKRYILVINEYLGGRSSQSLNVASGFIQKNLLR